ncbi:MAG TPA: phytanoyl-CoA dioxygenase family protein [Burkholderiales bacterium]|nr:phytanoyl-CoA dioxygenase family protein [Burkholderiales bacterium]
MPKVLNATQIEQFRRDGFVFPLRVMSEAAAAECRERLEAFERASGGPLKGELRHKSHLLFAWIADLVRHERILDAVEDLYGPNLFCWTTNFFIKEARNPAFVSWHQDSTYWGLDRPDVVTAWVALTPANEANGAMGFIPGSHLKDQIPHRDTFAKDNLLTRGQEVMVDVDASSQVLDVLRPGEMSLHHVRLVHGSPPNPSSDRRIGLAIRYIPTYVRQAAGDDSATLVRGVDEHHHFEHEPRPSGDLQPEFVALHKRIAERNAAILYRGTGVKSFNERQA